MHGGNSLDNDLAQLAIAPRSVFDRPKLGIGSLTDVEIICIILPNPAASIPGANFLVI